MGWCVVDWVPTAARPGRRGLLLSIFMLSARETWYLTPSLSSPRAALPTAEEEAGEAAPVVLGSGDTSLGGVGGKPKTWEPEWAAVGVREATEPPLPPPLPLPAPGYMGRGPPGPPAAEGCSGVLEKGLTVQGLWWCAAAAERAAFPPSSQGNPGLCNKCGRHIWPLVKRAEGKRRGVRIQRGWAQPGHGYTGPQLTKLPAVTPSSKKIRNLTTSKNQAYQSGSQRQVAKTKPHWTKPSASWKRAKTLWDPDAP